MLCNLDLIFNSIIIKSRFGRKKISIQTLAASVQASYLQLVQSDAPAGTFLLEHVIQEAGTFGRLDITAVRMIVAFRIEMEVS